MFVIGDISIGGGERDSWLRLYVLASLFLEIRKRLAPSKAEFNSLVGGSMGSKPFGKKAAVSFAFQE